MRKLFFSATMLAAMIGSCFAADLHGDWLVADQTAIIRIKKCGPASCGILAWAQNPGLDDRNPDPSKRNRSVIGIPILLDMKPAESNRWDGEVYNAENGKTYIARVELLSADELRIEGCILGGWLCGGENWTRAGARFPAGSARNAQPR